MDDDRFLTIWLALELLGGQVAVPILLLTFLLSPLKRVATLHSLLWSLVMWSIIDLLLFYAGRVYPSSPVPDFALCLVQSSLHHAEPVLTSWCVFALTFDTWIMLIRSTDILRGAVNIRRTILLIAIPWLAFVAVFVGSLSTGLKHRQEFTRERHLAYCSFPNDIWFTVSSILAGLALSSSLALTFHGLYFWHRLKAASPVLASNKKTDVPMMVRVVLLTATELIGALMSILSLASAINVRYADLVIATLPFGAWLIFVTQRDVLNEYVFWAKFLYHLVHHRQRLSRNEGSRHRPQETIVSFRTTVDRHLSPPSQLKSMRSTPAMDDDMPDNEGGMFYLVSLPMNSSQKLDNKSVEFSDEVLNVPEGKKDMGDDR